MKAKRSGMSVNGEPIETAGVSVHHKGSLKQERAGQKQSVILVTLVSLAAILTALPFIRWISVVNAEALYASLKLKDSVIAGLKPGYSLFNLLGFVQDTKLGILGLFAMILLLLLSASTFLHVVTFVRGLAFSHKKSFGILRFYAFAQAAMLLSAIAAIAALGFTVFSNNQFKMTGFTVTPVVYIILALSCAAYAVIKHLERRERVLQREHGFLAELRKNWILFVFLLPCIIFFLVNNYLPMIGSYFAFTQFNFQDGLFASPFVGLGNFQFLFKADLFRLTRNTILYNLGFIALGNVLQIFFAILVSQVTVKWFKRTSQTLILMPYFVSFVILNVMIFNLLSYDTGIVNTLITSMGGERVSFFNTPSYWPFLITIFYLWKNLGYGMVIYLATIMGINDEYYDAAKVDGANVYQQIRYVTLPHLKPTFIILLLYSIGGIMRGQLELFYQMIGDNGLLFNITDIIDTYVYRILIKQPTSMGMSAAAGLYQSVFGFAIIMVTNFAVKRTNEDYALF
jgi:ABC-type polysaccharide transport system permease subunit